MSPFVKALLTLVFALLVLLVVGPSLALARWQEAILFPAPTIPAERLAAMAQSSGATEVYARTSDGLRLYGWQRRAEPSQGRVLLYFHGNGESVAFTQDVQRLALEEGWDFVCVSPRGYPGSEGAPTRGSIARDARAAWDLVTTELGYAPARVVLHGRSLGGGLAGTLMAEVQPAGLVLESTFRSLTAIAREVVPLLPVRLLLRHRAPTEQHAPAVGYPVLILHGDQDEVIPVEHGRTLARRFPQARYVEARGFGHNDNLLCNDPEVRAAWRGYLAESARSSSSSPAN